MSDLDIKEIASLRQTTSESDTDKEVVVQPSRVKRMPSERSQDSSELDDDDLDLIDQNLGVKKKTFQKLRKKDDHVDVGRRDVRNLEDIFSQDEQDDNDMEVDEMDRFIASEDDQPGYNDEPIRPRVKKIKLADTQKPLDMGINEDAWRDIQDIFGDGTDYDWALELQAESMQETENIDSSEKITLDQVYEPSEIKARMLTDADETLRKLDQPERLQIANITPLSDGKLAVTALYISRKIAEIRDRGELDLMDVQQIEATSLYKAIHHVINFIHNEYLEVPFIILHRKDYIVPTLSEKEVWKVYEIDLEYSALDKRLVKLNQFFIDLCTDKPGETLYFFDSFKDLPGIEDENVSRWLRQTSIFSIEKMQDVHYYLTQKYPKHVTLNHKRQSSLPSNADQSSIPTEFILEYNNALSLSPVQYFDQISTVGGQFPEIKFNLTPLEIASLHSTQPETLLSQYRAQLAREFSLFSDIRHFIRSRLYYTARITVKPTALGIRQIDRTHPLAGVKYLKRKNVESFNENVLWLTLVKGEDDGLINITVECDFESVLKFGHGVWAEERKKIVGQALYEDIMPHFQKDRLHKQALDTLGELIERSMLSRIEMYGSKTDMYVFCAALDPTGRLCAVIIDTFGKFVSKNWFEFNRDELKREKDFEKLFHYAGQKCEVMCFGGNSIHVMKKVTAIESYFKDHRSSNDPEHKFMIVDDECARLFMDSRRALKELGHLDDMERYCVSLGRKILDPVMEYAGLVNSDDDIRQLKLHPMQDVLSEQRYSQAIEKAFIKVVFLCGVNINMALKYSFKSHTLQFVSGLGPRKAQNMITRLQSTPLVQRQDLITRLIVGANVFLNCASFIRIRKQNFKRKRQEDDLDPLDDTRIHPEDYIFARKMAGDAMDIHDDYNEEDPSEVVKLFYENPSEHINALDELDLDAFAEVLEKDHQKLKRRCLEDIKEELIRPFKDYRKRFAPLSEAELFTLLTRETDDTLYVNMAVGCHVEKIWNAFVRVKLSSNELEGTISVRNLSDEHTESCNDVVHVGQFLNCCVLSIDKVKMLVELSLKSSDMERAVEQTRKREKAKIDKDYCLKWEEEDEKRLAIDSKKKVVKERRIIRHSLFKNVDYKEAEKTLESRPDGDVIIRPSTKGNDHLSITWKIHGNVIQHIDIKEVKQGNKIMLQMEDKFYTELDELLELGIYPMNRLVQEMLSGPKFIKAEIDEAMRKVSQQCMASRRSQYGFILSRDKPGRFTLVYKHTNTSVRQEFVGIASNGFLFRNKYMKNVEDVVRFFKEDEARKSAAGMAKATTNTQSSSGVRSSSHPIPKRH